MPIDAMEELLRAGAGVNSQNIHRNAPLWVAVFNSQGRGEAIELLLRSGADPDLLNRSGRSPRQLAETIANCDVAQYFKDV
jgi:ankyrin repeat protein